MKRSELQHHLGMTMVLISGAMLFTTLLMGYAIYRSSAVVWPPMGLTAVSLVYPLLSTLTIIVSSFFMYQVKANVSIQNFKKARGHLDATLILGFMFLGFQTLFWNELKMSGHFVYSGIFASILYGFTWIHAAHVIMGLVSLVWLRFVLRPETRNVSVKTLNVEKFWHFLGVVWIIMFLTIFVL